jgi:Asp-tRNA(Asn)/Glu-tRNA(Gln) amidotransferase A subunit family amidase
VPSCLPVGMQIVGPHHADHLIVDVAELFDGILGSAA